MNLKIDSAKRYYKQWGWEDWIYNGSEYCGKILHFYPNKRFSLHFHVKKTETWYVQDGTFVLETRDTNDGSTNFLDLKPHDVIHIQPGIPHRLTAKSDGGNIFEVSTTHEDSDSYRISPGDSQDQKLV